MTFFWVTCPGAIANATKIDTLLFTPETRSPTLTHGSREKCKEFTVFSNKATIRNEIKSELFKVLIIYFQFSNEKIVSF